MAKKKVQCSVGKKKLPPGFVPFTKGGKKAEKKDDKKMPPKKKK